MTTFPHTLGKLAAGERLTRTEAREAMDAIMEGTATPAQIGAFLMALRLRGETAEEIAGAAESMRSHARAIRTTRTPLVDTCGTGGDASGTFNISTAAAFVVAGTGVAVAKHGNRSVSSRCGSADVLEALGARIDLPPEGVEACVETVGMGFLFAPNHHAAMRHAAGPRKELALRTLFNILGPLSNPAGATHQVLGVYALHLVETLAEVLAMLGSAGALVVHGDDGIDEISLTAPTHAAEWRDGVHARYVIEPALLGFDTTPEDGGALHGGDAAQNARLIRALLTAQPGPARDVVCLNAGAALYTAGTAETLEEGLAQARETVERGRAAETMERFVRFTREWTS